MSFKRVAYGVFLIEGEQATLIFSDEGSYEVYEKCEMEGSFEIEMESRWAGVTYEVKEVVKEVKASE